MAESVIVEKSLTRVVFLLQKKIATSNVRVWPLRLVELEIVWTSTRRPFPRSPARYCLHQLALFLNLPCSDLWDAILRQQIPVLSTWSPLMMMLWQLKNVLRLALAINTLDSNIIFNVSAATCFSLEACKLIPQNAKTCVQAIPNRYVVAIHVWTCTPLATLQKPLYLWPLPPPLLYLQLQHRTLATLQRVVTQRQRLNVPCPREASITITWQLKRVPRLVPDSLCLEWSMDVNATVATVWTVEVSLHQLENATRYAQVTKRNFAELATVWMCINTV